MKSQNISAMAKANGVNPLTAHTRIKRGMSVEEATSKPPRGSRNRKKYRRGEARVAVWAYLVDNKLATASEVAKATGVSYAYAHKLMGKIGTPREVFEEEAKVPLVADARFEDVSLDQFVADDTSSSNVRNYLFNPFIGVVIVVVVAAWVAFV